MKDLILSEIWIYPVKSLGGIRLTTAKVLGKGLLHDRRWMLLDENGVFMTQRGYPKMALFKSSLNADDNTITVTANNTSISFSADAQPSGPSFRSKVFDDEVEVQEVDKKVSEWFSLQFGIKCMLVSFP